MKGSHERAAGGPPADRPGDPGDPGLLDLSAAIDAWRMHGSRRERLDRLARYARWLDASVGIHGSRLRLGVDSILGFAPVVGDWAGVALSAPIVVQAWKLGARRRTLARMLIHLALEATVGAIPLAGDLFDVWFRANQRNVAMLLREEERREWSARGKPPA